MTRLDSTDVGAAVSSTAVLAPASRFQSVIFDCDSTLSSIEGIEELAAAHRAEVARLTEQAMRGEVPLEDVYGRRLELVRPSRRQVAALGDRYIETLVPDAREVVSALLDEGVDVRIISGGLLPAVLSLAHELGVTDSAVAAVAIYFAADGSYTGFDSSSPLTRAGGKRATIAAWVPPVTRPSMLVGDGATDLEARPAVDAFVAFAGVAERAAAIAGADAVIRSHSLAPVLPLALGSAPPRRASRALYERGRRLLAASHPTSSSPADSRSA